MLCPLGREGVRLRLLADRPRVARVPTDHLEFLPSVTLSLCFAPLLSISLVPPSLPSVPPSSPYLLSSLASLPCCFVLLNIHHCLLDFWLGASPYLIRFATVFVFCLLVDHQDRTDTQLEMCLCNLLPLAPAPCLPSTIYSSSRHLITGSTCIFGSLHGTAAGTQNDLHRWTSTMMDARFGGQGRNKEAGG